MGVSSPEAFSLVYKPRAEDIGDPFDAERRECSRGVLIREVHDDDFDGKPEAIKTFHPNGALAIVERDPQDRGYVEIVEYYDDTGKLIRREVRAK